MSSFVQQQWGDIHEDLYSKIQKAVGVLAIFEVGEKIIQLYVSR
jgi:hypothetical protein